MELSLHAQKNEKKIFQGGSNAAHVDTTHTTIENSYRRFDDLSTGLSTINVNPPIDVLLSFDLEWALEKDENGEFPITAGKLFGHSWQQKRLILLKIISITPIQKSKQRRNS